MKTRKIDCMILATFVATIFYASTYPYIHRYIMTMVSDNAVALNEIINCVGVIISGAIWNKFSDRLFPFYPLFCFLETICDVAVTVWALTTGHIAAYYILSCIEFSVITRNMICGGNVLRILRYQSDKEREHYQNNNNSASALASIIGSIIAMKLNLSFPIMLALATFGNATDNIFYVVIYYQTVKNQKK